MASKHKIQKQTLIHFRDRLIQIARSGDSIQMVDTVLIMATCLEIIRNYPATDREKKHKKLTLQEMERIYKKALQYELASTKPTYKFWTVVTDSSLTLDQLSDLAAESIGIFLEKI